MTRKPNTTGSHLPHAALAPRIALEGRAALAPRVAFARPRSRGISLAEMMIAVVILGLGLLMVATLFPVSWLSARKLAEHTTTLSCQEAANQTLQTLLKVDGSETESAMLPGDQIQFCECTDCSDQGQLTFAASSVEVNGQIGVPIPRVHTLNLGNVLFEGKRQFIPEDSWRLEHTRVGELLGSGGTFYPPSTCTCEQLDKSGNIDFSRIRTFLSSAVGLQDRVYPPLGNRPSSDFQVVTGDNLRWDEALATRRYAWSVFYRFADDYIRTAGENTCTDNDPNDGSTNDDNEQYLQLKEADATRAIMMYVVTVRRPRPTMRYALQDPQYVAHPDPRQALRDGATQIAALGSDKDLMFPSPWRVQVLLPEKIGSRVRCADPDDDDPRKCPTGVATEITVNDASLGRIDDTSPAWAVDLFDRGTIFIDELSGQIYRVEKRRLTDDDTVAHLTLDREIVIEDKGINFGDEDSVSICDPSKDPDCSPCESFKKPPWDVPSNRYLDDCERLRTVWVFPPPVQGGRGAGEPLAFDGSPPVVDISVRTLTISP